MLRVWAKLAGQLLSGEPWMEACMEASRNKRGPPSQGTDGWLGVKLASPSPPRAGRSSRPGANWVEMR